MTRRGRDGAVLEIEQARGYNIVALAQVAGFDTHSATFTGQKAVEHANAAQRRARTLRVRREAVVQLAVAEAWGGRTAEAVGLFLDSRPTSVCLRGPVSAVCHTVDHLEALGIHEGEVIGRLRRTAQNFAAATLDASLREHGVSDGFTRRHGLLLGAFHAREDGRILDERLSCARSGAEILQRGEAEGLSRGEIGLALEDLLAAGILTKGGGSDRFLLSKLGRDITKRLVRHPFTSPAPRVRNAPALV